MLPRSLILLSLFLVCHAFGAGGISGASKVDAEWFDIQEPATAGSGTALAGNTDYLRWQQFPTDLPAANLTGFRFYVNAWTSGTETIKLALYDTGDNLVTNTTVAVSSLPSEGWAEVLIDPLPIATGPYRVAVAWTAAAGVELRVNNTGTHFLESSGTYDYASFPPALLDFAATSTPTGQLCLGVLLDTAPEVEAVEEPGYILNLITNIPVYAAISTARKLTNTVTSPFLMLHGTDASEEDALFEDDATYQSGIVAFAAGGDVRIKTLYNQTGVTAQNIGTTTTNQMPIIAAGGTVQTLGGFPAARLNYDDTLYGSSDFNDQLIATSFSKAQPWAVYIVAAVDTVSGTDRWLMAAGSASRGAIGADATGGSRVLMTSGSILAGPDIVTGQKYLIYVLVNGGSSIIELDGITSTSGSAGSNTMTAMTVGRSSDSLPARFVEAFVLGAVPSADQHDLIVNNIKDFYGIPTP